MNNFSKVYKTLEKGRYFSTIWCTLDLSIISYLQEKLQPIDEYCDWVSTFGDWNIDAKYLPHISLRYLGFTDELRRQRLIDDREKFKEVILESKVDSIKLGKICVWEQRKQGELSVARLNWEILDLTPLKIIHNELLKIPNYHFFETLEGDKYNPHISLGQINLGNDNYEKVKNYLDQQTFPLQQVKLDKFAINYAKEKGREEFIL